MVTIRKTDDELQVVWAEVYVPNVIDSQGDFATAEEIRKAAWHFVRSGAILNASDVDHDGQAYDAYPVESFVARKGDPDFIEGAHVVAIHVVDPALWERVKKGDINGFSMEAVGKRGRSEVEIDIPALVRGETDEADAHAHRFVVKFDRDGAFLGGFTEKGADGHQHMITAGTATDEAAGHTHRFSFVEAFHG